MKPDPTRDPASEARDDHASNPEPVSPERPTPETDAMASMRRTHGEWYDHSAKLERQRDILLAAVEWCHDNAKPSLLIRDEVTGPALAAVKGESE